MATVTATAVPRSGPAISAALAEHAPADRDLFETELRAALVRAAGDLDTSGVDAVLSRWHALAAVAANPCTDSELAQLKRAHAGDYTGFYAQDESGHWVRL